MLTDEEVANIRRKLAEAWRGPVLLKWLEELLADRDELVARLRVLEAAAHRDEPRPGGEHEPGPMA